MAIHVLTSCILIVKDSRDFGWNLNGAPSFDWKRLIANKVRNRVSLQELILLLMASLSFFTTKFVALKNLLTYI